MILKKSYNILKTHSLCNNCLGRQFAALGTSTTNKKRGESIKQTLMMEADREIRQNSEPQKMNVLANTYKKANESLKRRGYKQKTTQDCFLCDNLFQEIDKITQKALKEIKELEFQTFLFGTKLDQGLTNKEEKFWMKHGADYSESIKSELNREIGKRIEKKTNKEVDFQKPEIVIHLKTKNKGIEVNINPIYVFGRYRKLKRGIPQNKWYCPRCKGEGCMRCDGTGYLYETSVEQIISKPLLELTEGKENVFHGCGKEDVDAKMLGKGRPFVMEVKEPKKRKINLEKLQNTINTKDNGIEIKELEFCEKERVREIKQAHPPKVYRVEISLKDVSKKELNNVLNKLENSTIKQETPTKISRRKKDTRQKKVYKTQIIEYKGNKAIIEIETESGLYIKELITGDEERTKPSLFSLLNKEIECLKLDVMEVKY